MEQGCAHVHVQVCPTHACVEDMGHVDSAAEHSPNFNTTCSAAPDIWKMCVRARAHVQLYPNHDLCKYIGTQLTSNYTLRKHSLTLLSTLLTLTSKLECRCTCARAHPFLYLGNYIPSFSTIQPADPEKWKGVCTYEMRTCRMQMYTAHDFSKKKT